MKIIKAQAPHHALLATDAPDAPVTDVGDGNASVQLHNVVLWFDTIGDRERDPRVEAWRLGLVDTLITSEVEAEKSTEAYREKAEQARAIVDGERYDPRTHDFIELEIRYTGQDALAVAQSIVEAASAAAAVARQALLDQEAARVGKREKQRQRRSATRPDTPTPPDNPGRP